MRQTRFKKLKPPKYTFGGSKMTYSPKDKRPLATKLPIHVVLKSHVSVMLLPERFRKVNLEVRRVCQKYGIKLYDYANVGNHLHLLIRVYQRTQWAPFIRELTGRLAQIAQRLKPKQSAPKFWLGRPFTRIVLGWRKAYKIMREYIFLNRLQGMGHRLSKAQMQTLKDLRERLIPL